jgi:integrase
MPGHTAATLLNELGVHIRVGPGLAGRDARRNARREAGRDRDTSSGRRTRLVVGELKTPKSRRTLALTPEMVAMFRQRRVRQAEAQMAPGARWRDYGLIFASEIENFSSSFSRLCQWAGLGHWHPHELRHSGALYQFGPGHAAACGLGRAGPCQHRDHQGRVRSPARR